MSFDPNSRYFGGYSPQDGTIDFYGRINSALQENMVVLDLGAGRAAWLEDDHCGYRKRLRLLKGKVAKVIATDVDEAVLNNRSADECLIMKDGKIPLPDHSVDLIVADYVLEHIVDVPKFSGEIDRVLKANGLFCARTPHKYNYICIFARIIQNSRHSRVLKWVQPDRKEIDVFPTAYKMNTLPELRRAFSGNQDRSFVFRADPSYYFGSRFLYKALNFVHKLAPTFLVGNLFVFSQKQST